MESRIAEELTEELIVEAFETIQEKTVDSWIAEAFSKGTTEKLDFTEEKWDHLHGMPHQNS